MIMSVLQFDLIDGKLDEFQKVFTRNGILEKAIKVDGCEQLFITSSQDDPEKVFVVGLWQDEAAYQRWMDHPERGAGSEELLSLVTGGFDPAAPAQHWNVLRAIPEPGPH